MIGMGAVGSNFARYAQAFGLHVIAVRRSPMKPGEPADEMYPPARLAEVLPRADWLMLTCPLTPETSNLINAEAIKRMKKGARLINVSRGEVVDEAAVIDALRSGQLGGAYIDPFTVEPLPKDSPFWDLPNVVITPHNAAASNGNEKRVSEIFVANFGRWVRGEPLANLQQVS
jgi:phosphoglycerate dehydrogenase-like enzyme